MVPDATHQVDYRDTAKEQVGLLAQAPGDQETDLDRDHARPKQVLPAG